MTASGATAGTATAATRVRVVAAALYRDGGEVLIAERPPGRHLAGRWEFPGGKVGPGESEPEALRRELAEELGIEVDACRHLMEVQHDYPDRAVALSLWIVERYRGEPRSLDGQRLKWVAAARLSQEDILEADRPFIEALQRAGRPARQADPQGRGTVMDTPVGERFEVRNPWSGAIDYQFSAPSLAALEARLAAQRAAQRAWAGAGLDERIAVMQRWKAAYAARQGEVLAALSADTGRYLIATSETQSIHGMIERWCRLAPTLAREEEGRSQAIPALTWRSQYVPYAMVGVISPWNFPLTLACIDAIPALIAGCAVFVKPSEITPRFVEPLMRSIADVPELAAVFHLAPGGRACGEALVQRSDVVCFTGSVRTGRLVAENAARHFVPVFLELGGKDPLIVTASADLETATDVALRASCLATGQACQSLERLYVHDSLYEAFVRRLVEKASRVEINWPDPRRGTIGPFIWGHQADIVAGQIAEALARGAQLRCGGQIEEHGGRWLRPTVLTGVDHTMQVMTEETFGPVMPVMRWSRLEEALALANDGEYGLSAAVVAGTLEEAEAIARRIDVGGVSLNDGSLTALMYEAEKNSFKTSGMGGSRMGAAGYTRFFRKKAIIRQTGRPTPIEAIAESNIPH